MSIYESPYMTQNMSPSIGIARRIAPPVPAGIVAVVAVADFHVAGGAVAEMAFDAIGKMPDAHDHPANAVTIEEIELMIDERAAVDVDQRLGRVSAGIAKPRAKAAGRMATGISSIIARCESLRHDLSFLQNQTGTALRATLPGQAAVKPRFVAGVEHEESAAAGADQLSAEARRFAWRSDTSGRCRHCSCRRCVFSCGPSERSSIRQTLPRLAAFQRLLALVAKLLDEVEIIRHLLVALAAFGVLILQDRRRRPAVSR